MAKGPWKKKKVEAPSLDEAIEAAVQAVADLPKEKKPKKKSQGPKKEGLEAIPRKYHKFHK